MASNSRANNAPYLDLPMLNVPTGSLELVKLDSDANAPQYDNGAEAPELQYNFDAPQTAFDAGPELAFDRSDPILITPIAISTTGESISGDDHSSRKMIWLLFCVSCVCLIAIAVGVGVGVGRKATSTASSPVSSAGNNQPTAMPLKGVVEDSSFAAVSTSDGNRRVFFQDCNGSLREAMYTHFSSSWSAATSNIVATDARKLTPLSATFRDDPTYGPYIYLFYVLADNTLGGKMFQTSEGWLDFGGTVTESTNITAFTTADDTRSLSVTILPDTPTFEACIFFEGTNNNISVMHGKYVFGDVHPTMDRSSLDSWVWEDLTNSLLMPSANITYIPGGVAFPYTPNATFGAPFESAIVQDSFNGPAAEPNMSSPNLSFLSVVYVYRNSSTMQIMSSHYINGSFSAGIPLLTEHNITHSTGHSFRQIINSDIVMSNVDTGASYNDGPYALWVNDSTITFGLGNYIRTQPTSPFPYIRMAVTNPRNSTILYLYHQANATAITEDVWDDNTASWVSSNFTITIT